MGVYYDKEKKYWYYQFFIQENGKRKAYKKRGFATKKEAEKDERIRRIEVENEKKDIEEKENSFDLIVNEYLDRISSTKKISTCSERKRIINLYMNNFFNLNIDMLNKENLQIWKKEIIKLNYSESRTNKIFSTMRELLQIVNEHQKLDYIIMDILKNIKKNEIKSEMSIWNLDKFEKFIATFDDQENRNYKLFFITLFYSGMRVAEIRAVKKKDIKDNAIYVNKTITSKYGSKNMLTTPKTKTSIRMIQMPKWIMNLLNEYIANKNMDEFVFSEGNSPFSENSIRNSLNKHCVLADVKKIRIHDFRHSHASYLINNGIPIKAVSLRLGHASVKTTMDVYWHLLDNVDDKIMSILDEKKTTK